MLQCGSLIAEFFEAGYKGYVSKISQGVAPRWYGEHDRGFTVDLRVEVAQKLTDNVVAIVSYFDEFFGRWRRGKRLSEIGFANDIADVVWCA